MLKIGVYFNFSTCSTPAFRMEKWGNSKVCLAVVSAEQQSGLVLKLLSAFGLVSLAVGNSQHAKGNEVGDGETPVSWHLTGFSPAGTLSSSHKFKHSVMGEAGRGPASSKNQHRLTSIPSHPIPSPGPNISWNREKSGPLLRRLMSLLPCPGLAESLPSEQAGQLRTLQAIFSGFLRERLCFS